MAGYLKRDRNGFTLLELLIVVGIIGLLAAIAIVNLIPAERRAKYARSAGDTKTIVTQAVVYINDNNCPPAGATPVDLWDGNGPTGGGACNAGPIPTYMAAVTDPFSGANYITGFSTTAANWALGTGFNGQDDTGGWDGVAAFPNNIDDLGTSSQTGCNAGTAAVVPSDAC